MAEGPSRTVFTGEQVLELLDSDVEEDFHDGMDEMFFPGSDDELGFAEEEIQDGERLVNEIPAKTILLLYLCSCGSGDDGSGDEDGGDDSSSGYGIT